jgi:hypothetical protein
MFLYIQPNQLKNNEGNKNQLQGKLTNGFGTKIWTNLRPLKGVEKKILFKRYIHV